MVRISGRHAQVLIASPHVGVVGNEGAATPNGGLVAGTPSIAQSAAGTPSIGQRWALGWIADPNNPSLLIPNTNTPRTAACKAPWISLSPWVRSIDVNGAGATDIVTGLNRLAHERVRLLYDLTGTLNGTIGVGKNTAARSVRMSHSGVSVSNAGTGEGNPDAPMIDDESAFILSRASNSDWTYDIRIEFGPARTRVGITAEVLITSFNVQRGDDGSLRYTADYELASGLPSLWTIINPNFNTNNNWAL